MNWQTNEFKHGTGRQIFSDIVNRTSLLEVIQCCETQASINIREFYLELQVDPQSRYIKKDQS